MNDATVAPEKNPNPAGEEPRWIERRGLFLITLAVAWFYFWTATSAYEKPSFAPSGLDYYNLLSDGFLAGQTNLKYAGDPGIAKLQNPYDPAQNAPYRVVDMSYYRGKYYIYFGPTPALLLLSPWKLLLGFQLPTHLAIVVFCSGGYVLSLLTMLRLRRRYFPDAGAGSVWLAALVLGLANMAPALLRRPSVYELAISCGYFFVMLAFWAVSQAWATGTRRAGWVAVASAAYGGAILARPTCIYGAVIFAALLAWWRYREGRFRGGDWLAAIIPGSLIFAGMLSYNQVRFGSPFEFGQIYQLTGKNMGEVKAFSWSYFPFNSWLYLLMPAQYSAYFPFFLNALTPPMPQGYDGLDDLYGVLPNLPVTALAVGAWLGLGRRARDEARELRFLVGLLVLWLVAVLGVFLFFSGATIRYYLDFLPVWLLLSCIGLWSIARRVAGRRWLALGFGIGAGGLAAFSMIFAVMVSFQHGSLLRTFNLPAFQALARVGNYPGHVYDRLTGVAYGPIKVRLKFPSNRRGQFEPLVVSGAFPSSDYLWVLYTDDRHIQIGCEHTNYGSVSTQPILLDYAASHTLEVDAGFLYPPEAHPYFSGAPEEAAWHTRSLRVVLDGVPYLDTLRAFYDPVSARVHFGQSPLSSSFGRAFTGTVEHVERAAPPVTLDIKPQTGPVEMALVFPENRAGAKEPLIVTGVTGRADLFYVEYLDGNHVRFGLDHWGVGVVLTDPVAIVPGYIHLLRVSLGSLYPAGSPMKNRLAVRLNGVTVIDCETSFHEARLENQAFGLNRIGGSSCGENFTGKMVSIKRGFPW